MKTVYTLLLVALSAISSYGQQALFKPISEEEVQAGLLPVQRLNRLKALKGYKKLQYVRTGDFKSIQQKGKLTFTLPDGLEPNSGQSHSG